MSSVRRCTPVLHVHIPGPVGDPVAYRVAGVDVICDRGVPCLRSLRLSTIPPAPVSVLGDERVPLFSVARWRGDVSRITGWMPWYDGIGELFGGEVRITAAATDEWVRIGVAALEPFFVRRDGTAVLCPAEDREGLFQEALLGPALVVALALRGTYCVHASSVLTSTGAALFVGPSGAGKSTLARELAATGGLRRLADDVAPVFIDRRPRVDPRFPQLKLPEDGQIATPRSQPVVITALYVLEPAPAEARVEAEELGPAQAAAAIVGQSVASRLFGDEVLDDHLGFCTSLAEALPVRRLVYPHRREAIREVLDLVDRPAAVGMV